MEDQNSVSLSIKTFLKRLASTSNNTVSAAKKLIVEQFEKDGVLTVEYTSGQKVTAENYAKMVARTAKTESTNATYIREALRLGTDIVECVGNDITCQVCRKSVDFMPSRH